MFCAIWYLPLAPVRPCTRQRYSQSPKRNRRNILVLKKKVLEHFSIVLLVCPVGGNQVGKVCVTAVCHNSVMCTVMFIYLHFTSDRSFTCWQCCSSPTLRLAFVSSAGKIVTTTVFWGEFGWLTLAIWKTCLKFPSPLSPPIFSQIPSSEMLLCHVKRSRLSERKMTLWFYTLLLYSMQY